MILESIRVALKAEAIMSLPNPYEIQLQVGTQCFGRVGFPSWTVFSVNTIYKY